MMAATKLASDIEERCGILGQSCTADILARENMGPRVRHAPGNALDHDFGQGSYDAVLVSLLVHHFTEEQNRELALKVARALKKDFAEN